MMGKQNDLIERTLAELSDLIGVMNPPLPVEGLAGASMDAALLAAVEGSDLTLVPADVQRPSIVLDMIESGHHPVVIDPVDPDGDRDAGGQTIGIVAGYLSRREFEIIELSADGDRSRGSISRRKLQRRLRSGTVLIARHAIQCDPLTSHDHHHHMKPTTRLLNLLRMDSRDIYLVGLFALIAGVLSLATPLAVESLVNVVSWGVYVQPLVWLGLILLVSLGLGGIFKILQTVIVEVIQRRQFVRIVGDLSHRYPLADEQSLASEDRNELANRFFDIMTIQKSTTVLLLDGISIVLSAAIGMALLAFYHPFLLGFALALLFAMIAVTWLLGRGGVRTAIDESIAKYEVAHWLQDVLTTPEAFKTGGGASLAVRHSNRLVADYLRARESQFRVVLRQIIFAIMLQVVASTALLGLGGYLVITGQLTLGQLVASELVVTVVVGAFSKAGKSIEKFYDMTAGVDKVGHLLDIETDVPVESPRHSVADALPAVWSELIFQHTTPSGDLIARGTVAGGSVEPGQTLAIVGEDADTRAMMAKSIAGMRTPHSGTITIGDVDAVTAAVATSGRRVGYVGRSAIFHGTLAENVDLGRSGITSTDVRAALRAAGLSEAISKMSAGLRTPLQSGGYPLTPIQQTQLMIARAIVTLPSLLIIDGALDTMGREQRETIWHSIVPEDASMTVIINTTHDDLSNLCDDQFAVGVRAQSV